ncbi:MAG TPA: PVC-type heme-binding CxxCH protein [Gemmataceae bacterium]|nr:PVC-type heme-binding CxxCH protein [Gemmataceae bacterium]
MSRLRLSLAIGLLTLCALPALAQKEHCFDNRKPSGQPYLKPEDSVQRMKVADGFEVKLFAAEPMVVNPIAMTVDEKGRVWVIECFEYPKRTAKGKMPRDRIVILEDTDGDGVADKRTVFAEGKDFPVPFDMASGLEVGNGGVYVGAPPYLFFIENKDDKPGKFEILLKGFGSQDTHETLNTFQWGPDGRLYGLHGVFTHSEVADPYKPDAQARVKLNAGVWRYDTRAKKFEVFAEGTSNPWGMDWRNSDGQFILCCCVIPHLYHISPGGNYKRQAGQSFNPYAYGEIKEICDHTFHKESGWAHAGLISLDTPLMPKEYQDSVIFGSIHGCSIKRNVLKKNGSTYTASRADDIVQSGDKNFRPINLRWGPNGEIYCIDWHDQNPCSQADPNSWDYEHGRVFRLQTKGRKTKKAEDLGKKGDTELVELLVGPSENPYIYRTALRLLSERGGKLDPVARERLGTLAATGAADAHLRLRGLWGAQSVGGMEEERYTDDGLQADRSTAMKAWTIRFAGESDSHLLKQEPLWDKVNAHKIEQFVALAKTTKAAEVRLQLASTARRLAKTHEVGPLLHALMGHEEDAKDPVIPQMLWLAYEQKLTSPAKSELDWLKDNAAGNALVSDTIVPRTMRRLSATGKQEDLAACVAFVGALKDAAVRARALGGLAQALENRQVDPPVEWKAVYAELLQDKDPEVQRLARHLAVNFQDPEAIRRALAVVRDAKRPAPERIEAIHDLALTHRQFALKPLLEMVAKESNAEVRAETVRALSTFDTPEAIRDVPVAVLAGWKGYPPEVRTEAVNLLAGRKEWAKALLDAIGDKRVAAADVTNNAILRIRTFKDARLNEQIAKVWGAVRDTPAELNALIDKLRVQIDEGRSSFARGQKVFENTCAKCHKFEGKGHDVGPNLDGAGRDIEYLLINVIDPNRVVGAPYFTRLVTLKSGRVESGLLAAEDPTSITLKSENDALKVIQKKDIDDITVSQKSVMPEGLTGGLKPGEFRDLVRYVMANPFLTEVIVSGPLDPNDRLAKDVKSLVRDAGVERHRPAVGVHGRIPLPAMKGDGEAVAVVEADVTAPAALKTRLLLGAGVPVQAWVNGKLVYDGKPSAGPANPDQAGVDVELKEGQNQIMLKATYKGGKEALYARLLDPNRKLRYPEPPVEGSRPAEPNPRK